MPDEPTSGVADAVPASPGDAVFAMMRGFIDDLLERDRVSAEEQKKTREEVRSFRSEVSALRDDVARLSRRLSQRGGKANKEAIETLKQIAAKLDRVDVRTGPLPDRLDSIESEVEANTEHRKMLEKVGRGFRDTIFAKIGAPAGQVGGAVGLVWVLQKLGLMMALAALCFGCAPRAPLPRVPDPVVAVERIEGSASVKGHIVGGRTRLEVRTVLVDPTGEVVVDAREIHPLSAAHEGWTRCADLALSVDVRPAILALLSLKVGEDAAQIASAALPELVIAVSGSPLGEDSDRCTGALGPFAVVVAGVDATALAAELGAQGRTSVVWSTVAELAAEALPSLLALLLGSL